MLPHLTVFLHLSVRPPVRSGCCQRQRYQNKIFVAVMFSTSSIGALKRQVPLVETGPPVIFVKRV